jgi:hypothetical protein
MLTHELKSVRQSAFFLSVVAAGGAGKNSENYGLLV